MTKSNNKNVTKDSINEKCFAYKRTYTKDNISHLKQKLSQENWNDILHGTDAECDYNMFIERFNKLYDECIPLKKYKVNRRKIPQSPWITKGILKSITTKNKLYKEYLRSPNEQQAVKFKTYRNKLNNLIRKSKREYFYSKFRNTRNNIKETSKTINSIIGRRKNRSVQSTFKTEQAEKLTDPKKISDAFNTFFVDIGPKLASKIQHTGKNYFDYLNQPASSCMYTKPVVPEEVVKIIAKFNQNKSPGHDDIGNTIVKKVATEISKPLSTIFNCSLKTGVVPEQLKIAKVIPIYKKEDVEVFSNYRPVSVLPCFSKILERLMFNRCMDYIDKNSILNEKQFGFRTNHSTYMAIIELVDKVVSAVERNESTLGIFLDLSKAFDTIDHDILLYKLEYYGFRGIVLDWFKSYLKNRKQFVRYQACDSEYKNIKCGVPQGSILGPLLFILYVNDITSATSLFEVILFADDTTLLYSHPDTATKINLINKELSEICNWFKANKLSVNASKTNYMMLGTSHTTNKYTYGNVDSSDDGRTDIGINTGEHTTNTQKINVILDEVSLERVNSTKFLVVIIDENLTWKHHIDAISKTISRNIGMLTKLKHYVPGYILYSLYCTLVLPYINYGILIWGNTYKVYLDKNFKLQKWAIRTISLEHYRSHTGPLFKKYNVLNVFDTFKLELGVFMYKHQTNSLPQTFSDYFIKHSQVHNYLTRNAQDYSIYKAKKVFADRATRTTGPTLWNSLDSKLKYCKTAKHFRNEFKSSLVNNYD